jgi:hypothetical protein
VRRESSTVIALVGHVSAGLLAALAESGNVSVARAAATEPAGPAAVARSGGPSPTRRSAGTAGYRAPEPPPWQAWVPGARALHEAARRRATYVVVANDPLAGVAAAWRAMWDVASGPGAAASFEEQAAEALAAWRSKQFELPDYYLVVAHTEDSDTGPDFYLGPLRALRARRVAVTSRADAMTEPAGLAATPGPLDTLRSLAHGPWWPPLDELLEAARRFHAGGLAETQQGPV